MMTTQRVVRLKSGVGRLAVLGLGVGSLIAGFTMVAGVSPAGALPTNLWVASSGSDTSNNCTVQADPCLTVTHAYNVASAGQTINLAGGTYVVKELTLAKNNLSIVGVTSGGSLDVLTTTIIADGALYALAPDATNITLSNLVINDATSEDIVNEGTATLSNVVVGWTTSVKPGFVGAGIVNEGGTLVMNDGAISGNSTPSPFGGGGLFNFDSGTATLHDVALNHNSATASNGEGGAITNFQGTVHLTGTTAIHNNTATVTGGGVEECPGTTMTFGGSVVITANAPNNRSTVDPGSDCA